MEEDSMEKNTSWRVRSGTWVRSNGFVPSMRGSKYDATPRGTTIGQEIHQAHFWKYKVQTGKRRVTKLSFRRLPTLKERSASLGTCRGY